MAPLEARKGGAGEGVGVLCMQPSILPQRAEPSIAARDPRRYSALKWKMAGSLPVQGAVAPPPPRHHAVSL